MGRITIFTEDNCQNSELLRSLLLENDIPHYDISLSTYPERRADMVSLTNNLVTPQVFFNSLHLGGLQQLKDLFQVYEREADIAADIVATTSSSSAIQDQQEQDSEKYNTDTSTPTPTTTSKSILDRVTMSVLNQPNPNHEIKLRLPPLRKSQQTKTRQYQQVIEFEYDSWKERVEQSDLFILNTCHHNNGQGQGEEQRLSIPNVIRNLMMKVSTTPATTTSNLNSTHLHYMKLHTNCFRGKDIIPIFLQEYTFLSTKLDAIAFGQKLLHLGILHGVLHKRRRSNDQPHNNNHNHNNDNTNWHQDDYNHSQEEDDHDEEEEEMDNEFTEKGLYRLQPNQSPNILNKYRLWSKNYIVEKHDPQPLKTLSTLTKMLDRAVLDGTTTTPKSKGTGTGTGTTVIDFSSIRKSKAFQSFEEMTCLLQLTNLDNMYDKSRLTFFINLYNLMVKHALVRQQHEKYPMKGYKISRGSKKTTSFYSNVQYMIGGNNIFSLDDIYHGILRCNAKHPKTGKEMFYSKMATSTSSEASVSSSKSDGRYKYKCPTLNPRIHFALISNYMTGSTNSSDNSNNSSGGGSSSSCGNDNQFVHLFKTYEFHQEAVNIELFIIAQQACTADERIMIDENKCNLNLPKFIKLYLNDFVSQWNNGMGIDNDYLPRVMSKYLIGEKRQLLDRMIKNSNASSFSTIGNSKSSECLTVTFRDNMNKKSLNCLLPFPWTCVSSMKGGHHENNKSYGGGFPQAIPEEDELHLLDQGYDSYEEPQLSIPEFDVFSQSSSLREIQSFDNYNAWDMISTDNSSWNLSLRSWELPNKVEVQNEKIWETFTSISFDHSSSKYSTKNKKIPPTPRKSPPTPHKRKMVGDNTQSPSNTVRTASTTRGSPSPNDTFVSSTPDRVSRELVMPEFQGNSHDGDDDEGNCCVSTTYDDNISKTSNCSGPPKARRTKKEGLFKEQNEENEGEEDNNDNDDDNDNYNDNENEQIVTTKDIINIFFPPMDQVEMKGGHGHGDDDDNDDLLSYYSSDEDQSQSFAQKSTGSLLSRNTQFDMLFNSSMASI